MERGRVTASRRATRGRLWPVWLRGSLLLAVATRDAPRAFSPALRRGRLGTRRDTAGEPAPWRSRLPGLRAAAGGGAEWHLGCRDCSQEPGLCSAQEGLCGTAEHRVCGRFDHRRRPCELGLHHLPGDAAAEARRWLQGTAPSLSPASRRRKYAPCSANRTPRALSGH